MKCVIPEISYHNRDPILSLDFQLTRGKRSDPVRLATAGSDSHVVIFAVTDGEDGQVELELLSDLTRHERAVNIVRWSPDGSILASGDDASHIILWQLKQGSSDAPPLFGEDSVENKENWVVYKIIKSHLDDVYDLCWSPCSQFLISGSVDNTAIITNVHKNQKVGHLSESQGFVQGVAWNPKHPVLTTISSDRKCRFYNSVSRKKIGETYKAFLSLDPEKMVSKKQKKKGAADQSKDTKTDNAATDAEAMTTDTTENKDAEIKDDQDEDAKDTDSKPKDIDDTDSKPKDGDTKCKDSKEEKSVRLFHDDTFKGFFRRLSWSNDGELLMVPSGVVETDADAKLIHCTYVFTRIDLSKPSLCLPTRDKYTIAVKFCPILFKLRPIKRKDVTNTDGLHPWEMYSTLFALPYRHVYAVATQNAVMIYDTQQSSPIARVSNIHYTGLTDLSWSPNGRILIVSSSDGFCSIITFSTDELGEEYVPDVPLDMPVDSAETPVESPSDTPLGTPNHKQQSVLNGQTGGTNEQTGGFNEHGVKSPAQIHIKSNKEGGKSNPKRLKFITLSSPKADKRRPGAHTITTAPIEDLEDEARDGMEGVEPMDTETSDDLRLELEDTLTQPPAAKPPQPEKPKQAEKKRVPLISIPTGPNTNKEGGGGEEPRGKRVELITLSSPKPKSKH